VATAKAPTLQAVAEAGVAVQCRTRLPQGVHFREGSGGRAGGDVPISGSIDVVLTCDHDEDIAFLVSHSKRALRVIRQNVTVALATKFAFLVFAAFGAAPLWLAVVADTGATVLVTLNGLRLLRP
jgi:Zn2+/Cd2+-exporting ATPase